MTVCEFSDLSEEFCAHCRGHQLPEVVEKSLKDQYERPLSSADLPDWYLTMFPDALEEAA